MRLKPRLRASPAVSTGVDTIPRSTHHLLICHRLQERHSAVLVPALARFRSRSDTRGTPLSRVSTHVMSTHARAIHTMPFQAPGWLRRGPHRPSISTCPATRLV